MKTYNLLETLLDFIGLSPIEDNRETIQNWREFTFNAMLNIGLLVITCAYIIATSSAFVRGETGIFYFNTATFLILLFTRFGINKKYYKLRVNIFLVTIFLYGIYLGTCKTLVGDARIWLLFLIVIAEVLLGGKVSLIILAVCTISWYGVGLLFQYEILDYPLEHLLTLIQPGAIFTWRNTGVVLFALGLVMIVSIRVIIYNLIRSLNQSRNLTNTLQDEIKAREKIEQHLRNSEQRYRGLFENSPMLIMELDKDSNIRAVNPAMAKSLGYDVEILEGGNFSEILPLEFYQNRIEYGQEALSKNEIVKFEDERNGIHFFTILVPSPGGESLQVISQDITEREKDRLQILHFQEHLTDLVKRRTDDLFREVEERKQIERKALEAQKLADIGLLATGMAHELNSPLQGILTNSYYLLKKYDNKNLDHPSLREKLVSIKRNVLRCTKIMSSLRNYSYAEPGELSPNDLSEIVHGTLLFTKHQFEKFDNISIITELEADMPSMLCDRNRIMQALINLLINARDAMPRGGKITIQSNYSPEKRQFVVKVIDTGDGIKEEILKRLFTPFLTTKPVGQGTGLGLYIAHGFVQARGGTIDVQSTSGEGTVVTLVYPEDFPDRLSS